MQLLDWQYGQQTEQRVKTDTARYIFKHLLPLEFQQAQ
jgi:hypothetical protein